MTRLAVNDDQLVTCVACGLCLPHCPTYRVTGDESASPRGRIAAMRAVQSGAAPLDAEFTRYMTECVQCRACEAACPSSVAFGHLMEGARETLADETSTVPWWQRVGYAVLGHHRLLLGMSRVLAVVQRARLVPRRLGIPRLPLRAAPLQPTGTDVWLFTGCVMDAWQRDVHAAAIRVLGAAGVGVALPDPSSAACCGALHIHAGLHDSARALARRAIHAFPGDAPILVDSAGCGAALRDYGHLLDTDEAHRFSSRVVDINTWLAQRIDRLPAAVPGPSPAPVAVHDPCHLRHVQHAHLAVRTLLRRYVPIVELDDDGLCCGAGGAYAALQPELADSIRARKLEAITRTGAPVTVSANPGCTWFLGAAGVDIRHPLEIVDAALTARRP
ncbi:MAG TPA: heterodisulfide reductase-related iron-sulfur binding cluster [Acidimicrobiia bacterium]|nr:heterodisulfide reductase-related iron-sulfur binding cluster [Acidimicrobiia bacterium]